MKVVGNNKQDSQPPFSDQLSFEHLIDVAPDAMIFTDSLGQIILVNNETEKMFGYYREELMGQSIDMLIPEKQRPQHKQHMANYSVQPTVRPMGAVKYLHALRKNGDEFPIDLSLRPVSGIEPLVIFCAIRDITRLVETERALKESERRYRHMYEHNPMMLFTLSKTGTIITANDFGAKRLGYDANELIGIPLTTLVSESQLDESREFIQRCFEEAEKVHHCELEKRCANGEPVYHRNTAKVFNEANGEETLLLVCEDITEAQVLTEELAYQASHDSLTGLINRREFELRLGRVISPARLADSSHALGYLDLDQFKIINDTCGHIAGDELLRQIGSILNSKIRKRDSLARLGGDEFAVLLEDCDMEQAIRVTECLRKEIEKLVFVWDNRQYRLGVSIGLVPILASDESVTSILRNADSACYTAKDMGRNRIHIYRHDDGELARRQGRMQWIAKIQHALENDRFQLWKQIIVAMDNKHDQGLHYEILLRMLDDAGKPIPPGAFLPAAERYDLSTNIDRWVISHTFDWLSSEAGHIEQLHTCSINLSGLSVCQDEFLEFIHQQLSRSDIPAEKICFEITETAAISNLCKVSNFIDSVHEMGCRFALDDFGSGLSSFAYLNNLQVDYLKIDGVFIKDICTSPVDRVMVKSINEIGQVLGKMTIAECVEDKTTLDVLKELGLDYAQGYGIADPEPIA